ncbi:MAG TPA: hypothetical protein DD613_03105 [Firmicutes bacterium]|nr:hypothetical protein [Bacillota bacterium]
MDRITLLIFSCLKKKGRCNIQRKQLTLVIVSLLVVVLSVSLAYFTIQIIGKGKTVDVSSANLQIVLDMLEYLL